MGWWELDDRTLVDTGMAYSEKTMEVAENLVQALLAALDRKSTPEQKRVLEQFAEYEGRGGGLSAVRFDAGHLKDFARVAGEAGLVFYGVRDPCTSQVTVITRDRDIPLLEKVAADLASQGKPLYPDPQVPVAEFVASHGGEDLVFDRMKSLEQVGEGKFRAAEKGITFAVGRQPGGSYLVVSRGKDREILGKLGIVDSTWEPEKLFSVTGIREVRETVRQERERMEQERQRERGSSRTEREEAVWQKS